VLFLYFLPHSIQVFNITFLSLGYFLLFIVAAQDWEQKL